MRNINIRKAQSFDLMQYLYGSVHHPLIHARIQFNGALNESLLKQAILLSIKTVPEVGCRLDTEASRPRWVKQDYRAEDFVQTVDAEELTEATVNEAMAQIIDVTKGPQLKATIVRERDGDTLCVVMNHMICDGAGFKDYLYLLAGLYTGLCSGSTELPAKKPGRRDAFQLFRGFSFREKREILFARYDLSKQREQPVYQLQGNTQNAIFARLKLDAAEFSALHSSAKRSGFSINDCILAAYIRVLHSRTGANEIVLPCPVDLRKYMPNGTDYGICNLTSNYICDITVQDGDKFETTVKQVAEQMNRQKSSPDCLKSVLMLGTAFRLTPFPLLKKLFHKIFKIPVLSYTNLGTADSDRLVFFNLVPTDCYLTGAVKFVPYFQIAVSTYRGECTLSCNLYGTESDRIEINQFLADIKSDLLRYIQ